MEFDGRKIVITHVNIRQSIVFLLFKLIATDFLAALVVIIFFSSILMPFIPIEEKIRIISVNIVYFLLLLFLKIALVVYIVLQWLNEYYEITGDTISHRRGIIWKKDNTYVLDNIKSIGMKQGMMGRIFNYGTLTLYDQKLEKYITVYIIHNPVKYLRILESLVPRTNEEKEVLREHIIEQTNENL